ncbi:protein containing PEGA domain [Bacteroidales bacterium 6E]|nr:protein containing PEGA domain [Bacteroidales bacterium 6E]
MKKSGSILPAISILLSLSIILASCSSTTLIQSNPSGAKIYVDGEPVGDTPYSHTDTKIVGSTTTVKIVKEGYEPFITSFSRDEEVDVGAVIGGFFVMVPFLWTMKYKPARTYELSPVNGTFQNPAMDTTKSTSPLTSKAERLRELKGLLDDGIITLEEFETEKKKILEDNK